MAYPKQITERRALMAQYFALAYSLQRSGLHNPATVARLSWLEAALHAQAESRRCLGDRDGICIDYTLT